MRKQWVDSKTKTRPDPKNEKRLVQDADEYQMGNAASVEASLILCNKDQPRPYIYLYSPDQGSYQRGKHLDDEVQKKVFSAIVAELRSKGYKMTMGSAGVIPEMQDRAADIHLKRQQTLDNLKKDAAKAAKKQQPAVQQHHATKWRLGTRVVNHHSPDDDGWSR